MDDRYFDEITRRIGSVNRRTLFRGVLGLGGVSMANRIGQEDVGAARRGYAGPPRGGSNESYSVCVDDRHCCVTCQSSGGDRFRTCYENKDFCEWRRGGCCLFCMTWAGDCWY